ncbi:MAG TPA: S8 family serine peptidase [Pyrinomonadaceae bacterium]
MYHDPTNGHNHSHAQNRFAVIPTAQKLAVDARYSARGIRIAFLDSGFYPHPDFAGRVVAFHDISGEDRSLDHVLSPAGHHWHGTQTVASCAGDGSLCDGTYRGLAHMAELVLIKVSRAGHIRDPEIEAGLVWVVENRERLNIRILNISLGGDCDLPTRESRINSLVDELTERGVAVTVAAGNSSELHSSPPASAQSAITVGGYSDGNQISADGFDLYHSSNGATVDGLVKPELIAPAMYVAAPILPGTSDYAAGELLSMLAATPDYALAPLLAESWQAAGLHKNVLEMDAENARRIVESELHRRKIIATHYQHVDGTSFAAPITASVIALMLEANPGLTPAMVKNILVSTASRLTDHPSVRQGFGVLNAPLAIAMSEGEVRIPGHDELHSPKIAPDKIHFRYHSDAAERVALAGDFNEWYPALLRRGAHGLWECAMDRVPAGRYRYKFLIDDARWTEDPSHGLKEDDGYGGFNSLLIVE